MTSDKNSDIRQKQTILDKNKQYQAKIYDIRQKQTISDKTDYIRQKMTI